MRPWRPASLVNQSEPVRRTGSALLGVSCFVQRRREGKARTMTTTERGHRSRAFGATPNGTCWRQSRPLVLFKEAAKLGVLGFDSVLCLAHLTLLSKLGGEQPTQFTCPDSTRPRRFHDPSTVPSTPRQGALSRIGSPDPFPGHRRRDNQGRSRSPGKASPAVPPTMQATPNISAAKNPSQRCSPQRQL